MRARHALAVLAILLAPVAAAAPVQVELDALTDATVQGDARVEARVGALDLGPAAAAGLPLRISFERAVVTRVTYLSQGVHDDLWSNDGGPSPPERSEHANGTLDGFRCGAECHVLLVADGGGTVALEGDASGGIGWLEERRLYCGQLCTTRAPDFRYAMEPGDLAAGRGDAALALGGARPSANGTLRLFLENLTADLRDEAGQGRLDVRNERRPIVGLAGGVAYEEAGRHAVVELRGARLEAPDGTPALLAAREGRVTLHGTLSSPSATGRVAFLGQSVAFDDEPLALSGDVAYGLASGAPDAPRVPRALPVEVSGSGEGDAREVRVGARVLREPAAVSAPAAVAGGTALAGLLLVLAILARPALLAPLYVRIEPSRILQHENRARIYGVLRERPGRTVADLRRETGLSRMVVEHHLAMLEAHRLVAQRGRGRRRFYFPSDVAPQPSLADRTLALADATRRLVAQAVAARAGATQRDLMAATGLSQRLVSYHLSRLLASQVVRAEGLAPRRYHPAPGLGDALREAGPAVASNGGS